MSSVWSHKHWVITAANNDQATLISLPAIFIAPEPLCLFIQILRKLTRYQKAILSLLPGALGSKNSLGKVSMLEWTLPSTKREAPERPEAVAT
jgi:hypothetical protein